MVDLDSIPTAVVKYYAALGPKELGHLINRDVDAYENQIRIDTSDLTLKDHFALEELLVRWGFKIYASYKSTSIWIKK